MEKDIKKFNSTQHLSSYVNVYRSSLLEKESEIEKGLNFTRLNALALNMGLSTDILINMLGLSELTPTFEMSRHKVLYANNPTNDQTNGQTVGQNTVQISPKDFKIIWPATLSKKSSGLILQLESLIGQTVEMINESGNPGGFNAAAWMVGWINSPNRSLVGRRPAQYLNTLGGHKIVSDVLAISQLGA